MSNAAAKMKEMQANGESDIEIAKVFLTACRAIGKNVEETTVEAAKEGIAGISQLGTYETPDVAAIAFGQEAQPMTDASGKEAMAVITPKTVLKYEDGRLSIDKAYELGKTTEWGHNNVIGPTADAAFANGFGLKEYYVAHTHPYCTGHQNNQFSTGFGDQAVVDQLGATAIYLVEPSTGNVYKYDGSIALTGTSGVNDLIATGMARSGIYVGNTGVSMSNYYICRDVIGTYPSGAAWDDSQKINDAAFNGLNTPAY